MKRTNRKLIFITAAVAIAATFFLTLRIVDPPKLLPAARIVTSEMYHKDTIVYDYRSLQAIRSFLHQMDSLRYDPVGVRTYDSICWMYPGLMEKARAAERFFKNEN